MKLLAEIGFKKSILHFCEPFEDKCMVHFPHSSDKFKLREIVHFFMALPSQAEFKKLLNYLCLLVNKSCRRVVETLPFDQSKCTLHVHISGDDSQQKHNCAGSSGAVHSVILIDVYLDLEKPWGVGILGGGE
jgi:hypothetical protein